MKRIEFIKRLSTVMVVGVPLITIATSCSNDDDPAPGVMPNCLENGTTAGIGSNHGHTLSVSKADVESGVEKTYSIQGDSGHNHDVTVSEANFTSLMNNQSITTTSTNDSGHTHSVTISCV